MNFSIVGIIVLILVIIFVIRGWKIGLVKAVFDLLSFFIVGILTWLLYPTVSNLLIGTPLYDGIHNWIELTLKDNAVLSIGLPEFINSMPLFIKESIQTSSKMAVDSFISSTADALAVLTLNAISMVLLFVSLNIISFFIRKLGKFINKIVIIGPVNMFLGGFFGFMQGIFICYIVIMIISYFPASSAYNFVAEDLEKSYVGKIMYNEKNNFLGFKPIYPVKGGN